MKNPDKIFLALIIILVTCVTIMGCSGSSDSTAASNTSGTVTADTTTGPLYTAGDIVRSASGGTSSGWLIVSYDSATDSYTRAFIYKNSDGTWGYRINSNTETSARSVMEKVYTVKITHVTVSSIPTAAPTPVVTTTVTTSGTTSATATITTVTTGKPQFKDMIPDEGYAGSSVSITDLVGSNFQSGATIQLTHSGSTNITATDVAWVSSSHLTCTFTIPSDAAVGAWNVVITNPDGQSVTYANYFTVHTSSTTATTTTSTSTGDIGITSVTGSPYPIGMSSTGWVGTLIIDTSTTLQAGTGLKVTLTNSAGQTISVSNPQLNNACTEIRAYINQPVSVGTWDVKVTNPDGKYGTLSNGFTVR